MKEKGRGLTQGQLMHIASTVFRKERQKTGSRKEEKGKGPLQSNAPVEGRRAYALSNQPLGPGKKEKEETIRANYLGG